METAKEGQASLREVPGLVQKVYMRPEDRDTLAGFYLFDSAKSLESYREGKLPERLEALGVKGEPETRRFQVENTLYEQK